MKTGLSLGLTEPYTMTFYHVKTTFYSILGVTLVTYPCQTCYFIHRKAFHFSNQVFLFFERNKKPYHCIVATRCLRVSTTDVHHVRRLPARHLPRARPDTSSSPLPLAPWQWIKGVKTSLVYTSFCIFYPRLPLYTWFSLFPLYIWFSLLPIF